MSTKKRHLTRRQIMKYSAIGAAVTMTSTACSSSFKSPGSSAFYTKDGAFDPKKAKDIYLLMLKGFGYPIPDTFKTDEFWVCDFVQKDFALLGMGGIFWKNASGVYGESGAKKYNGEYADKHYGYLGHEIFLLPGQLLPEHRHIGGAEGYGPKMESWHVRYGTVEFFGEYKGAGDETLISDMPENERPWGYGESWFKSKYVAKRTAKAGKLYTLEDPESWHFQRAGAQGAIVSEYATYHNHVTFSKPGMVFENTKA